MVGVHNELSPLKQVVEMTYPCIDGKQLSVECGIILLSCLQLFGKKSQWSGAEFSLQLLLK